MNLSAPILRTVPAVAVGGVLGAAARWAISEVIPTADFPWSTLLVNVLGSLILGWALTPSGGRSSRRHFTSAQTGTAGKTAPAVTPSGGRWSRRHSTKAQTGATRETAPAVTPSGGRGTLRVPVEFDSVEHRFDPDSAAAAQTGAAREETQSAGARRVLSGFDSGEHRFGANRRGELFGEPAESTRLLRLAAGTGFCGAFTTFSGFAVETVQFFDGGQVLRGIAYLAATLLLGLGAAIVGRSMRRSAA